MLLIDIGNTRIKAALAMAGAWQALPALASAQPCFDSWRRAIAAKPAVARVLVASVAGEVVGAIVDAFAREHCGVAAEFVHPRLECAGMRTTYRDPRQLGVDRWLAALAAFDAERAPVCVVDAGTALTVDVVDSAGRHLGGLIAPGPALMHASLTRGTARLASAGVDLVSNFADNTADAISLGCGDATRGLLHCVAERLHAQDPGALYRWYLTGGAAPLVAALADRGWIREPELVLRGLTVVAGARV